MSTARSDMEHGAPQNLLASFGWSATVEESWRAEPRGDAVPARVVSAHRTRWEVVTDTGFGTAGIAGRFHAMPLAERPAVGDWVALRRSEGDSSVIDVVLSRTTELRRVAAGGRYDQVVAANLDTVFIVGGLDGDHEPRRLRRYLALVRGGGATPVVVLNKVDLADDPAGAVADLAGIDPDVAVHLVSASDDTGIDDLAEWLRPGETIGLLGSSGVGKSTIVNRLLEEERQATHAVRLDDSMGRHTTTRRELIPHASGAVIMDTPGMRELALVSDASDLDAGFADIAALAETCRFGDCRHEGEPGCAVQAAIDAGEIPAGRLDEYKKLEREAQYDAERRHERHARERAFGKMVKDHMKRKRP